MTEPADESLLEPFWEHVQSRRVALQFCDDCGQAQFPPARFCSHCLGRLLHWREIDGHGRLWSWCRYFHVYDERFREAVPYNVALVELDAGPCILSSLVNLGDREPHMDMRLRPAFDTNDRGRVVLRFEPAA